MSGFELLAVIRKRFPGIGVIVHSGESPRSDLKVYLLTGPARFKYRILLVDDEEALLQPTADVLTREGYLVQTARDGFEALAVLRASVLKCKGFISQVKDRNEPSVPK